MPIKRDIVTRDLPPPHIVAKLCMSSILRRYVLRKLKVVNSVGSLLPRSPSESFPALFCVLGIVLAHILQYKVTQPARLASLNHGGTVLYGRGQLGSI